MTLDQLSPEARERMNRFLMLTKERGLRTRISEDKTSIELLDAKTGTVISARPLSDFTT